jgi:uncharacterized repeat protein (TIGR04076 family)
MSEACPVRMTIVAIDGGCPSGHQIGEQYLVEGRTPAGICMGSFNACAPYLTALRFGASFPWESEEGVITIGCPDHVNQVVWRLERVREQR